MEEDGTIRYDSSWAGKTPGIRQVVVYLYGEDPLTGKILGIQAKKEISWKYDAASTRGTSAPARYYGTFQLRYDAIADNGSRIPDFIEPKTIELRVKAKMPKIRYQVTNEKNGYSRISFEGTNCLRRCNGRLWVKYGGKYQRIPRIDLDSKICYFPGQAEITVIAEQGLPTPEKTKG